MAICLLMPSSGVASIARPLSKQPLCRSDASRPLRPSLVPAHTHDSRRATCCAASAHASGSNGKVQRLADDPKQLDQEIYRVALPMLAALVTEPLVSLVDTAFIGHMGAIQLAGMAVGLSIFNTLTKFMNIPVVSATTTLVASAVGKQAKGQAAVEEDSSSSKHVSRTSRQDETVLVGASVRQRHGSESASSSGTTVAPGAAELASTSGDPVTTHSIATVTASGVTSEAGSFSTGDGRMSSGSAASTGANGVRQNPSNGQAQASPQSDLQGPTTSLTVYGRTSAVSTAASASLLVAAAIGITQAVFILWGAPAAASTWGLDPSTPAHGHAVAFMRVRALGAPFGVLLLALQGVFRGLQDTKTPLMATLACNLINLCLAPILIFTCGLGIQGAAAAIVIAQTVPTAFLFGALQRRVELRFAGAAMLAQLQSLFGPSAYLILRTVGAACTYAVATSVVARTGAAFSAAHQVCFQLWMSTTMSADALAVAAQALLARSVAAGDLRGARAVAERCIVLGMGLGAALALGVGIFRHPIARVFTSDEVVLALIASVMPALVVTQPINALAFVGDGVLFGAGGFKYSSVAMAACALPAIALISWGASQATPGSTLVWVWAGLSVLMTLRSVSIAIPWLLKRGPFRKLAVDSHTGVSLTWGSMRIQLA